MMEFIVRWPEDADRVVPVPGGSKLRLITGDEVGEIVEVPEVTSLTYHTLIWRDREGLEIGRTELLWLPDAGSTMVQRRVTTALGSICGVLANRRGAAALARAAWGTVASKYDAFLSVNLDANGPGDRRLLIPWVDIIVRLGTEETVLSAAHIEAFEASPDSLMWSFQAHGMRFSAVLALGDGNAMALKLELLSMAPSDAQILLRPWLEDRSFHTVTQAFRGPEHELPARIVPSADGFHLALDQGSVLNVTAPTAFLASSQWRYCIALPECAARGLEPHTDAFSPGSFVWQPSATRELTLTAVVDGTAPLPLHCPQQPLLLPEAMEQNMDLYLADRGGELTVIAGFPWFLDWGRDSLIYVRGLIAAGRLKIAGSILRRFASFEKDGTLPNLLRGEIVTNRDTSDAPLWLIVGIGELIEAGGSMADEFAPAVRSILNARRTKLMHAETGLIFSASHYTWMDTDSPPYTPRVGYPIEIQALWHAALRVASTHFGEPAELASLVQASIQKLFWLESAGYYADCLHADFTQDTSLRPNQWLAITLGAVTEAGCIQQTLKTTQCLLVPGAARSLASHQPGWWPRYTGPEEVTRKPAYHNGTAWGWQYPLYAEALLKSHGTNALPAARRLLSATAALFDQGCLGQLPEITDGALPHYQRGCSAQAWSVSEWVRVWHGLQTGRGP
jgi:starch synthase (maltosyl-transferring)